MDMKQFTIVDTFFKVFSNESSNIKDIQINEMRDTVDISVQFEDTADMRDLGLVIGPDSVDAYYRELVNHVSLTHLQYTQLDELHKVFVTVIENAHIGV